MILLLVLKGAVTAKIAITGFQCPKTYAMLIRHLPLRAQAHRRGGSLWLKLGIKVGVESHRTLVGPSEVVYWPPAASILISLWRGCFKLPSPVNPLGVVVEGMSRLSELQECITSGAILYSGLPTGKT